MLWFDSRILHIFAQCRKEQRPVHFAAPMVRYSKLPFRMLVLNHGADVAYTPMMLAHEFIRSQTARDSDFTHHPAERGPGRILIAQFASHEPGEFARAAEMIAPWIDGVNLNCGCPQSWAIKEGIGCSLMEDAPKVAAMVRAAKMANGMQGKSVSVKIRIDKDLDKTIKWVEGVQGAGVDYITVHGRTRSQRSSTSPNYEAVRKLREVVEVPMVANGDAYTLRDVTRIASLTAADGVMAARGLMGNPALFDGVHVTPESCVGEFLEWCVRCPIPFPLLLHHVCEMTARMEGMNSNKKAKRRLLECKDLVDLIDLVEERWALPGR